MKKTNKMLPLSLAAIVGIVLLTGCNGGNDEAKVYTLHEATSGSPEQWAPATWKTTEDSVVPGYTEIGLVDYVLNDAGNGYEVVPEMAAEIPTDVTSTLTEAEATKYGMEMDVAEDGSSILFTSGQKWQVKLNQAAKWADGSVINADTYVESLKDILDPEMQNYRSGDFANGSYAIAGGLSYLRSGQTLLEPYFGTDGPHAGVAAREGWYFNAYTAMDYWESMSLASLVGYMDKTTEHYAYVANLLADTDTFGTSSSPKDVRIDNNEEVRNKVYTACQYILTDVFGMDADAFKNDFVEGVPTDSVSLATWCSRYYKYDEYSFDNVGIEKVDDYTFNVYFKSPLSDFYSKQFFSSNWIVKQDLWEALRKPVADSGLYTTTYGTSLDTYVSYGPYKLTVFQMDKEFDFERNENWYGYSDGKHEGQYQVDRIEIQYIDSEDTMLSAFRTGKIDSYSVRAQDLEQHFGSSSRLLYTPQSYTTKLTVNSEFDLLKTLQDGDTKGNHTILSNLKFRQALSLGLDRKTLCQTQTAGWRGFDVPINFMYVSDPETGVAYRETEQGKKVVTDNFGTDSDGQPNYFGYDVEKARELINEAVAEETSSSREGHYVEGQKVHLVWEYYNEGWLDMINWVVNNYKELVKGTKLEGLLDIELKETGSDYADHIVAGACDFGISTWGGAQFDPFGVLECYTVSANMYEPAPVYRDSLTINLKTGDWSTNKSEVSGEEDDVVTMTLGGDGTQKPANWTYELNSGKYSAARADSTTRLNILSACESYLVGRYNFISWGARQSVSIDSYRVTEGTNEYVQIVGFGGIRKLKLTRSDAEWSDWVKQNSTGGFIDYNR